MSRTRRPKAGDICAIALPENTWGFGRILEGGGVIAFYDLRTPEHPPLDEIIQAPIAFKVWVSGRTLSKKWQIIGNVPLEDSLKEVPLFSTFRRGDKGEPMLSPDGSTYISSTPKEAGEKEFLFIWEPEHIEERLCSPHISSAYYWRMKDLGFDHLKED